MPLNSLIMKYCAPGWKVYQIEFLFQIMQIGKEVLFSNLNVNHGHFSSHGNLSLQ